METFKYTILIVNNMSKEVSNKVVIILLVIAFIFSIGGTFLVYESVNDYKESRVQFGISSGTTGMVSLEVVEDYSDEGGNEVENFE